MAPIAIAPRVNSRLVSTDRSRNDRTAPKERELLGAKRPSRLDVDTHISATSFTKGVRTHLPLELDAPISEASPIKTQPSELEKVVRRIPTLYVIAFFGVVVLCAVSIIWNTLQVNRLTLERTRMDDQIAQTEQRLIKLRAEEMQLSAPSRIRQLASDKLGMVEATGEELVVVH